MANEWGNTQAGFLRSARALRALTRAGCADPAVVSPCTVKLPQLLALERQLGPPAGQLPPQLALSPTLQSLSAPTAGGAPTASSWEPRGPTSAGRTRCRRDPSTARKLLL